ncbi:MAG: hypothetical protein WD960_01545 [Gemmatimonadota bacterium]
MSRTSVCVGAIILGASLVLSACGSSPVGPVPDLLLREAWEWQSACCGIAGDTRTPTTEGFSYVLRFSESGVVRAERNGTIVQETTFRVRRVSPVDFADEFTEITYGEPLTLGSGIEPVSRQMLTLPQGGRLFLSSLDPCADCFGDWVFLPRLE